MGKFIDQLSKQVRSTLPEHLISGIECKVLVNSERTMRGLNFLADRYLDVSCIRDNMHPVNDTFPQEFTIDASAIKLAFCETNDNGLISIDDKNFKKQLSELWEEIQNAENNVLDEIELEETVYVEEEEE